MPVWLSLLERFRARRRYRETYRILRELDVPARADIGVAWLEIDGVARKAALRAAG